MYQLRRPAPELEPYVEHYWFVTSTPAAPVELRVEVFVDARADLVFNRGAPYVRTVIGGECRTLSASNLDAQRLEPIRIQQRGLVHTTGVRFRLGGLAPFAIVPLQAITGRTVPPGEVLGPAAGPLEATLGSHADDPDAQSRALDAFFLGALARAAVPDAFSRALSAAVGSGGNASVTALAEVARVSSRHLERLFARHLGVPPKTLARVVRFQTALAALMREPEGSLAEVAVAAGYFDQAHFIRDFRRMTGGVPRGYRGYYPPTGPSDFAPNVVVFIQEPSPGAA